MALFQGGQRPEYFFQTLPRLHVQCSSPAFRYKHHMIFGVPPDSTFNGGVTDAYVAKLNPNATALLYATFLGGTDNEGSLGRGD